MNPVSRRDYVKLVNENLNSALHPLKIHEGTPICLFDLLCDKKWQRLLQCPRLITIFFKVSSHLVWLSFGSQIGKRDTLNSIKPIIIFLISHCLVIRWSSRQFLHSLPLKLIIGPDEIGEGSPYATHDVTNVVCTILFFGKMCHSRFPKYTHFNASRLLNRSFHSTLANCPKQRWSNTTTFWKWNAEHSKVG